MLFPHPRFTVRRLMVAVAIVAVGLGVIGKLKNRRDRIVAAEAQHVFILIKLCDAIDVPGAKPLSRSELESSIAKIEYHRAMYHKYDDANRFPWSAVPPDPPEPE